MKKWIGFSGGIAATIGLIIGVLSMNHCSTSSPTLDGVIGTSSAKLDTGSCTSGNWTCTTSNGLDVCTCDTGVSYGCPIGAVCNLQDGGPQDYGFCGFSDIQGNFSYENAFGSSAAQIVALNGHWQMQFTMEHLGDQITGNWNCARQSNFNPAQSFSYINGVSESNSSSGNPDTKTVPGSVHWVCPWTGMIGMTATNACLSTYAENDFHVNPLNKEFEESVYRDTSRCSPSTLKTDTNCTNTGSVDLAYGLAHPGNTNGYTQTFYAGTSTAGSQDTGAVVSDTICYITGWTNQSLHVNDPVDHIWLTQSGSPAHWFINKNWDYQQVTVTCIPYDQT
jgi:hypothetical protein